MKKKKSIIILSLSLLVVSLVSYMAFATGDEGSEKSPLDFALFATENIHIYGTDISFKGDIWANKSLTFNATTVKIEGNTWSNNDIKERKFIDGVWNNNFGTLTLDNNKESHIITDEDSKKMINLMESVEGIALENGKIHNGNMIITTDELNRSSIIAKKKLDEAGNINEEGNITGDLKELNNYIVADGKIDIKASNAKGILPPNEREDLNNKNSIVIASKKKTMTPTNLTLYDSSIRIKSDAGVAVIGSIYAPDGNVYIEANSIYIIGNIIAKNIYLRTSYLYGNDEGKIIFKEDL